MTDVEYERRHSVASIRLNRPRYRNAQSRRLLAELDDAFGQAASDEQVRVIVLIGNGSSFSSGHDLGTPEERDDVERPPIPTEVVGRERWSWEHWSEPLLRWRSLPKPTIAAVSGNCIYAGWSLASAMDIRICADNAVILPHLSEYFSLPWLVGASRAKEILFRNRTVGAAEALRYGMVEMVVGEEDLEKTAWSVAEEIAALDPGLLRSIKSAVNGYQDQSGYEASLKLAHVIHVMADCAGSQVPMGTGGAKPLDLVAQALSKLAH